MLNTSIICSRTKDRQPERVAETLTKSNLVLILKAPPDDDTEDAYIRSLRETGIRATFVPTLQFQYKNLEALKDRLDHPEKYSGILFTSTRSVNSVTQCLRSQNEDLNVAWRKLKCFVVGEATAHLVTNTLELICNGSSSGNLENLLQTISTYNLSKPLLVPVGSLHKHPSQLNGILLDEVEVYNTIEHVHLKSTLKSNLDSVCDNKFVVFFSPSGVKAALQTVLESTKGAIHLIAIGPTTAKEIQNYNANLSGVCEKPSPQSLVDTVCQIIGKRSQ